jgi:hypothetical protein
VVQVDEPRHDQQRETRCCTQSANPLYSPPVRHSLGINIHLPVLKSLQNPSLRYLAASSLLIFLTARFPFFSAVTASTGFLARRVDSCSVVVTPGIPELVGDEETGESAASPRCSLSGIALHPASAYAFSGAKSRTHLSAWVILADRVLFRVTGGLEGELSVILW